MEELQIGDLVEFTEDGYPAMNIIEGEMATVTGLPNGSSIASHYLIEVKMEELRHKDLSPLNCFRSRLRKL